MRKRRDGEETRRRLLEAAVSVFGEKGFHQSTHAEIGAAAGVNPALINFHFGSKDGLYRAVWDHVTAEAERLCPHDGGISRGACAACRLGGIITSLVRRALGPSVEALHRIRTVEMIHPTGLLDEAMAEQMQRHRSYTLSVLRELLGESATERDVLFCEMSVIGQCRVFRRHGHRRGHPAPPWQSVTSDASELASHITTFSLAGISALRQAIERRGGE